MRLKLPRSRGAVSMRLPAKLTFGAGDHSTYSCSAIEYAASRRSAEVSATPTLASMPRWLVAPAFVATCSVLETR